jgi:hypothetical protein
VRRSRSGAVACALLIGGLGLAAWRTAEGLYWFRLWVRWRVDDPSAAELYQVNWWIEAGLVVLGLAVALVGFYVLVRRRRLARP